MKRSAIRYRVDVGKMAVVSNFERRGWNRATGDDDWNIYWATVQSIRAIFNPDSGWVGGSDSGGGTGGGG